MNAVDVEKVAVGGINFFSFEIYVSRFEKQGCTNCVNMSVYAPRGRLEVCLLRFDDICVQVFCALIVIACTSTISKKEEWMSRANRQEPQNIGQGYRNYE